MPEETTISYAVVFDVHVVSTFVCAVESYAFVKSAERPISPSPGKDVAVGYGYHLKVSTVIMVPITLNLERARQATTNVNSILTVERLEQAPTVSPLEGCEMVDAGCDEASPTEKNATVLADGDEEGFGTTEAVQSELIQKDIFHKEHIA